MGWWERSENGNSSWGWVCIPGGSQAHPRLLMYCREEEGLGTSCPATDMKPVFALALDPWGRNREGDEDLGAWLALILPHTHLIPVHCKHRHVHQPSVLKPSQQASPSHPSRCWGVYSFLLMGPWVEAARFLDFASFPLTCCTCSQDSEEGSWAQVRSCPLVQNQLAAVWGGVLPAGLLLEDSEPWSFRSLFTRRALGTGFLLC